METALPRTRRATLEAWLGQMLLPMTFNTLLIITAVNYLGLNPWVGGLGLAVLLTIACFDYILPMLRNWMRFDERSIEGSINGRYFYLYWTEIAAAWTYVRQRRHYLCLGTREVTLVIPLRFFDREAIWEHISASASPTALTEEAVSLLPDFQRWSSQQMQISEKTGSIDNAVVGTGTAVADHWLLQVAGWSWVTFFLLGLLDAFTAERYAQAVLFGVLMLPGVRLLLSWGLTEFSLCEVERYTLLGKWRIRWDAVRRIEISVFGAVMVLIGEDSQVAIPGPGLWSGEARRRAHALLIEQAKKHGIPMQRTLWAVFKFSRRSRFQK